MTAGRVTRERTLLRRHAWVVVLLTLLTTAAGVVTVTGQPQTHTAEAEVQVLEVATTGSPIAPDMGTERELALSGRVAAAAAQRLETTPEDALSGLDVSVITDTNVLVFEYTAPDEKSAYAGAGAFATSYLDARNARQAPSGAIMITRPTDVDESRTGGVVVIIVCLLVGLALGAACAWLWDRVSGRVRSSQELARAGLPVLGAGMSVPRDTIAITWQGRQDFAFLAGRLDAELGGRASGVRILVTAPRDGSGTSAVALNVAAGVAGLGRGAVLVDANTRTAGVSSLATGPTRPGLPDLLNGAASVTEVWRPVGMERVRLVPSPTRRLPFSPDVEALERVLEQLGETDVVVIDGPPLLEAAVAALLADHVDVVLLVGDLGTLRRADVAACLELLEPLSASLVGWVTHGEKVAPSELALDPGADVAELPHQRADVPRTVRWRATGRR